MRRRTVLLLVFVCLLPAGCARRHSPTTSNEPPVVSISQPVEREVTDFVDFTGRTDAPESVDIKARVTGYLTKIGFKPGDVVKKGDLLFLIDPRPYQADVDKANGSLAVAEAKQKLAVADYKRALAVRADNPAAISQQEVDQKLA